MIGEQPNIESQFKAKGPTAVAIDWRKNKYFVMSGDFTEKSLTEFSNGVLKNRYFFLDYSEFPEIVSH